MYLRINQGSRILGKEGVDGSGLTGVLILGLVKKPNPCLAFEFD